MIRQQWILLLLAVVMGVLFYFSRTDKADWLAAIWSNLSAGFLGSFLTVVVVDRALKKREQSERLRIQRLAMQQLKSILIGHVRELASWFKAASSERPVPLPTTAKDLFSDTFFETVRYFDFAKAAPNPIRIQLV